MKQLLQKLLRQENLSAAEMETFAEALTTGQLTDAEAAAMLMGLAIKGETEEEIFALVKVLRSKMAALDIEGPALDTCGTGGDGANTINASTISAFVCAAAGVPVVKHGNRAVSSKCGSFDLLEALGIKINLSREEAEHCFKQTGLVFLFAPNYHPAFKFIAPLRKSLGVRTVFNFLGPLLNPAKPPHQLIGVSSKIMAKKLGSVLLNLGSERAIIVESTDGLDEISVAAPTNVYEFSKGQTLKEYVVQPDEFFSLDLVRGKDTTYNAERTKKILAGQGTLAENEFISLNAGMALYAYGVAPTFKDGKELAKKILLSGAGFKKMEEVTNFV